MKKIFVVFLISMMLSMSPLYGEVNKKVSDNKKSINKIVTDKDIVIGRVNGNKVTLDQLKNALRSLSYDIKSRIRREDLKNFIKGFMSKKFVEDKLKREGKLKKFENSNEGKMLKSTIMLEKFTGTLSDKLQISNEEFEKAKKKPEYARFKGPQLDMIVRKIETEKKLKKMFNEAKINYEKVHPIDTVEVSFKILKKGIDKISDKEKKANLYISKDKKFKLTIGEFLQFLKFYNFPGKLENTSEKEINELAYNALHRKIMVEVAKEHKIDKSDSFKNSFNNAAMDKALEEFYKSLENEVKKDSIKIEDAKKFYEENKKNGYFNREEEVKASHILVDNRKSAEIILQKIKNGEKFEDLARKYSKCPSKERGGDLGYFSRSRMVKPFSDAAFKLKEGEVSGIVKTRFGYHIIKLTGRKKGTITPFEQVKDRIMEFLLRSKKDEHIKSRIEEMAKKAKIEIFSDKIPKEWYKGIIKLVTPAVKILKKNSENVKKSSKDVNKK